MERCTDVWMATWTYESMVTWIYEWMNRQKYEQMNGQSLGHIDEEVGGWMDGFYWLLVTNIVTWKDGQMNGYLYRLID